MTNAWLDPDGASTANVLDMVETLLGRGRRERRICIAAGDWNADPKQRQLHDDIGMGWAHSGAQPRDERGEQFATRVKSWDMQVASRMCGQCAVTFERNGTARQLDHVVATKLLQVRDGRVLQALAYLSDHRPFAVCSASCNGGGGKRRGRRHTVSHSKPNH